MSDPALDQPPRAHARIVYLGPVSPHWEVYGDYGERTLLDEFRARVLARLVLLPRDDPQFRRNRERIVLAVEHVLDPPAEVQLVNRELSWLQFNDRVLSLAAESGIPLLERVKFCAIS